MEQARGAKCAKWSASQWATEVYLPAFLSAVEGQVFALWANSINQLVMKRDISVDGGKSFSIQVPGVSQGSSKELAEKPSSRFLSVAVPCLIMILKYFHDLCSMISAACCNKSSAAKNW